MSSNWPKFKKFTLLKQVGVGGMGTIYLSQISSGPGAGRIVVLKSVSSEHAENAQYRKLFESEIRVMLGFSHPNIVTLLDVGEENGCLYFTLEWVDGKNLKDILNATENKSISPEFALGIAIEAAQGLSYAHHYIDRAENRPCPVVHRDVSPSNILVGYDGRIRVIDFGIAKTLVNSEEKPTSAVMGKARYMSPEQFRGHAVDVRTDIFSLAVVLWESLTGKRLFQYQSDASAMSNITNPEYLILPPSKYVSGLPKELDVILLKALNRDRAFRFTSMLEFAQSLKKVLNQMSPDHGTEKTANFLKSLFLKEIEKDCEELQKLCIEKANKLSSGSDDVTTLIGKPSSDFKIVRESAEFSLSSKVSSEPIRRLNEGSHLASVLFEIPVNDAKEIAIETEVRQQTPYPAYRVRSSSDFSVTEKKTYHLRIVGGFLFFLSSFFLYKHNERVGGIFKLKEAKMTLARPPSLVQYVPIAEVQLEVHPSSPRTTIRVGEVPLTSSMKSFNIPFETPTQVTVEHPGFQRLVREISISSDSAQPVNLTLNLVPEKWGTLSVNTDLTAEIIVKSGDLTWNLNSPVDGLVVPEGTYTVTIKNQWQQYEKTVLATVKERQAVHLDEQIKANRAPASK